MVLKCRSINTGGYQSEGKLKQLRKTTGVEEVEKGWSDAWAEPPRKGRTRNLPAAGGKISRDYAWLAVAEHEQWQFKHMHARIQAYTSAHSYWSPAAHSQICLLLLSKAAVKSSIICIHHLHTGSIFSRSPPSMFLHPVLLFALPPPPTKTFLFFHMYKHRAHTHTTLRERGGKSERHLSRLDDCHSFPPHLLLFFHR